MEHRPKVIGVLALLLVAWLIWGQFRESPFIVSGFIEADQIRVGSQVGGRVADVLVEEGDLTQGGDSLFTLEPFDLQATMARARGQLAVAEAEHERLQTGFRVEEIAQAQARFDQVSAELDKAIAGPRLQEIAVSAEQLKIAEADLELAEAEFKRLGALVQRDQASKEAYDESVRARKAAAAQVIAAKQNLALLREGTRVEDLAAARANLAEAEQALALLREGYRKENIAEAAARLMSALGDVAAIEARLQELDVRAPCDCVVEAVELRPGDLVPPNAPAIALLDLSRMWVRSYVPEARLSQIKIGQSVPIRVDGLEDERFGGKVVFIAQEGEFTPRNIQTPEERSKQVFRIKVMLEEGLDRLRVGMATDVLFNEAEQP